VDIVKNCLLDQCLGGMLNLLAFIVWVIRDDAMDRSSFCLAHYIIDMTPKTPVLLMLDDGQDFSLPHFLLGLSGGREAVVQVLCLVVFSMFPIEVAMFGRGPKPHTHFGNWDGEAIQNPTPARSLLEVSPISDQSEVVPKQRPVHQGTTNPQGSFRGERNTSRLYLPADFLRVLHQLFALTVNLVDPVMELPLEPTPLVCPAKAFDQSMPDDG
jgi:hypothetical protein